MPQPFREALKPLPKPRKREWKERKARGAISQDAYEMSRGKAVSWKPN